ncbi:hypothetical protein WMY93_033754 [Mugilogobius chulae]|uniref:MHC class I antigen n=1 Tax=Mugilogobius chulae TaxID=88201 RepID=A0AAW0MGG1_9GOBI
MKIAVLLLLLQVATLCSEVKGSQCDGKWTSFTVTNVNLNKNVYWDYGNSAPDLYVKASYLGKLVGKSKEKYGHKSQSPKQRETTRLAGPGQANPGEEGGAEVQASVVWPTSLEQPHLKQLHSPRGEWDRGQRVNSKEQTRDEL